MGSEDSTNPARKRKYIYSVNEEYFHPKFPLLSSPPSGRLEGHQDGKDDQPFASPSPDTPAVDPTQSTSEKTRERYLKEDPLALVLSPSFVECRQCKKKIKLSSKSAYDPFHWRNHRTRCMKAHKRKVTATNRDSNAKKSMTPPLSPRLSSLYKGSLRDTPPLISDCGDDDRVSDRSRFGGHANSPTPSSSFAPAYSSVDNTFNDYLRRSHPDYAQPAASVQSAGRWRSWSWSQLKPPRFPVADDDSFDDDMDANPPDSFDMPSDIFRWSAASSMSFVSSR